MILVYYKPVEYSLFYQPAPCSQLCHSLAKHQPTPVKLEMHIINILRHSKSILTQNESYTGYSWNIRTRVSQAGFREGSYQLAKNLRTFDDSKRPLCTDSKHHKRTSFSCGSIVFLIATTPLKPFRIHPLVNFLQEKAEIRNHRSLRKIDRLHRFAIVRI